jgi:hypothetical protein
LASTTQVLDQHAVEQGHALAFPDAARSLDLRRSCATASATVRRRRWRLDLLGWMRVFAVKPRVPSLLQESRSPLVGDVQMHAVDDGDAGGARGEEADAERRQHRQARGCGARQSL